MSASAYDVTILGAGISGLTCANILADQGLKVCVLDTYDQPGGNHISRNVGEYTFDIGAIFFWPSYGQFKMFPGLIDLCVPANFTMSRLLPNGEVARYPFSPRDEVFKKSPLYWWKIGIDITRSRLFPKSETSALDYIENRIGNRLFIDSGLKNYFRRFYGRPASEIDIEFARKRINIDGDARLGSIIARVVREVLAMIFDNKVKTPAPSALARPPSGFNAYYSHICDQLLQKGVNIRLNQNISALKGEFEFEVDLGNDKIHSTRLVNTFPIKELYKLMGINTQNELKSTSMITLFCSFEGKRNFDNVILYNFHNDGSWKRLTMHSDYYGEKSGRSYFSVEFVQDVEDVDLAFEDFCRHISTTKMLDGDIKFEGSIKTDFAYPIYEIGSETTRLEIIDNLARMGIESLGRQGRFDYIPTSKLAVAEVQRLYGQG